MLQGQALEIVLNIVKSAHVPLFVQEQEKEAIEEVESLLTQFEDTGNYTEDDYMEEPATGCDYGIGG